MLGYLLCQVMHDVASAACGNRARRGTEPRPIVDRHRRFAHGLPRDGQGFARRVPAAGKGEAVARRARVRHA